MFPSSSTVQHTKRAWVSCPGQGGRTRQWCGEGRMVWNSWVPWLVPGTGTPSDTSHGFEVSYSPPSSSFPLPQIHRNIQCPFTETNLLSTTGCFTCPSPPLTSVGMKHFSNHLVSAHGLSPACLKHKPHFSSNSLPATTPLFYLYPTGCFAPPEMLTLQ